MSYQAPLDFIYKIATVRAGQPNVWQNVTNIDNSMEPLWQILEIKDHWSRDSMLSTPTTSTVITLSSHSTALSNFGIGDRFTISDTGTYLIIDGIATSIRQLSDGQSGDLSDIWEITLVDPLTFYGSQSIGVAFPEQTAAQRISAIQAALPNFWTIYNNGSIFSTTDIMPATEGNENISTVLSDLCSLEIAIPVSVASNVSTPSSAKLVELYLIRAPTTSSTSWRITPQNSIRHVERIRSDVPVSWKVTNVNNDQILSSATYSGKPELVVNVKTDSLSTALRQSLTDRLDKYIGIINPSKLTRYFIDDIDFSLTQTPQNPWPDDNSNSGLIKEYFRITNFAVMETNDILGLLSIDTVIKWAPTYGYLRDGVSPWGLCVAIENIELGY